MCHLYAEYGKKITQKKSWIGIPESNCFIRIRGGFKMKQHVIDSIAYL